MNPRLQAILAALAAKTVDNGCTEDEAMEAAAKLQELLEKHGMTEADMKRPDRAGNKIITYIIPGLKNRKKVHEISFLLGTVAKFFNCTGWKTRNPVTRQVSMVFTGYEQDVIAATILLQRLHIALESGIRTFIKNYNGDAHGNAIRKGFAQGFGARIHQRLMELKEQSSSSGNALVILKDEDIKNFMENAGVKLSNASKKEKISKCIDAIDAGFDEADKFDLNDRKLEETRKLA